MLKQGDTAPDFSLKDSQGKIHKLNDYLGKKIVLYFYPKDDTPGCTKEACNFRDSYQKIKQKNVAVLGVSSDDISSHKKFQEKYKLPFALLSDPNKEIIKKFGVLQIKNIFGIKKLGIKRSTFIINEEGKIIKVFPDVSPENHINKVLDFLS